MLRREIGERSDGRPDGGQLAWTGGGDPEVRDPGPTVGEEDVRRLEVTVDDLLGREVRQGRPRRPQGLERAHPGGARQSPTRRGDPRANRPRTGP